ncbi:MAG TPA: Na-translocating system protein MpsC family protein [Solirubrobacterales bacterium]|nr:Na-translocating system protein MpsC family protein [Solirubrobacterales bacterium]
MPDSIPLRGGELNAAITREVIRVHSDSHGRGPKKAFTVHNGNVVITVLEEVLSPAERKLVGGGESEAVLKMRQLYQRGMGPELKQSVETLTQRRVTAFMSDNHVEPDMAVEIFILDQPLG